MRASRTRQARRCGLQQSFHIRNPPPRIRSQAAQRALQPLERTAAGAAPVAVVGCGVIGLATALQHKRQHPTVPIHIISDQDVSGTTSYGSGGFWEPYQIMGTPDEVIDRWGEATFRHLAALAASPAAPAAGVFPVTCHGVFRETVPELPSWRHIVNNFRVLDGAALERMGQPGAVGGFAFESIIADQSRYLPWLQAQLRDAGGAEYRTERLASLQDLEGHGYQAVFNCAGLGARELMGDGDCLPIRGQVRRVRAPWIKGVWFLDDAFYILPQVDCVVVGGTQQRGDERATPDAADTERIWRTVTERWPALRDAEVVSDWAGLRPARSSGVRLEKEALRLDGEDVPVVHCYGHGGCGVTLHWGCVQEAVALCGAVAE